MARTIIEDYYKKDGSHFALAYDIPERAREIQRTRTALVNMREDKPIVIALREISERQSQFEQAEEDNPTA